MHIGSGTMPRTLSDEDCDAIVQKLFERLSRCLEVDIKRGTDLGRGNFTPAVVAQQSHADSSTTNPVDTKLVYSSKELSVLLGISSVTLWRLQVRGLLHAVPGIRQKISLVARLSGSLMPHRGGTLSATLKTNKVAKPSAEGWKMKTYRLRCGEACGRRRVSADC